MTLASAGGNRPLPGASRFLHPTGGTVEVDVGTSTSGDTGCRSPARFPEGPFDLWLESKYEVDCARVRRQGYCAVRTDGR